MPRPADESLMGSNSPGFGGNPTDSFNLGNVDVSPIHSLDVEGAGDSAAARALAAVFSKGGDLAEKYIDNKAAQQGAADQAAGAAAVVVGQVDPQQMETASRYAIGVKRAQAQATVVGAAEKARAFAAQNPTMSLNDSTDEHGNTVPGLLSSVDGIFRNAFPNGQETDPVVANLIAPIVQHTHNEILGAYYQNQVRQSQQQAEDATTGMIVNSIVTGAFDQNGVHTATPVTDANGNQTGTTQGTAGMPVNMGLSLDTLTKVYGGDQRAARDALVRSVGEAAVRTKRPDIIDSLLPAGINLGGGATLTPENLAALDAARQRADIASKGDNTMASYAAASKFADKQASGQQVPEKDIQDALSNGLISEGAALQLHSKNAEIARDAADAKTWTDFFQSGNHWSTTGLAPDDVRKHMDSILAFAPPEQRIGYAVGLTATQGIMPSALKQYLATPALQDANGLQHQLAVYAQLRQSAPAAIATDVPEQTRALYERATQLSKTGMQPPAILKELQSYDPAVAKQTVEDARPDINTAIKAGPTMAQSPGTGFMGFGRASVKPSDYTNGDQVNQMIREQAEVLVGRGFTPAAAVSTAAQNVYDSSVTVKTPQGQLMIPRTGGEAPDVGAAVTYLFKNVGDLAKANNIKPEDIRLAVQPGTQGRSALVLVGPTGETLKGPFTLNDLYAAYTKHTSIDKWQAGQNARAATDMHHQAYIGATEGVARDPLTE